MTAASSYIPLGQTEMWRDIKPIPQDDGPDPLAAIMYAEEYRDLMDYFRAVSVADEHSERVLELTESIIRKNPSHYTIWAYRINTLQALKKDLGEELQLMNEFARQNLKTYQVWNHRLTLMTLMSPENPISEIDYIHDALVPDPKNYHTWTYLHWLYAHFSSLGRISEQQWADELVWCEEMLRTDGRNNSAWGWRWFLRVARPQAEGVEDGAKGEIVFTLKAIHDIPHNVSAWNYLRGVLNHLKLPFSPLLPAIMPYTGVITGKSPEMLDEYPTPPDPLPDDTPLPISHALEFLADALVEQGKKGDAAEVYERLGQHTDRMRGAYWDLRRRQCLR